MPWWVYPMRDRSVLLPSCAMNLPPRLAAQRIKAPHTCWVEELLQKPFLHNWPSVQWIRCSVTRGFTTQMVSNAKLHCLLCCVPKQSFDQTNGLACDVSHVAPPSGINYGMRPANERRCYNVTASLIGWAHTQNNPCSIHKPWGENPMKPLSKPSLCI